MIIKTTQVTVPFVIQMPGGLITASIHTSMVGISISQLLVVLMVLFGMPGKVGIILSSSQR